MPVIPPHGSGGRITGYGGFAGNGDISVQLYDNTGGPTDAVFSISAVGPGFEPRPRDH